MQFGAHALAMLYDICNKCRVTIAYKVLQTRHVFARYSGF
jgi:hypothetical protein